ncbi:MAG: DNA-processing protein DprA [Ruminiclostridium sp.]|nr:DNA-processing protein DprA [Ruminiclostridium sp.]MBQ9852242.1 DNA-processing protein DprA [Ruminiclostridium sp.]
MSTLRHWIWLSTRGFAPGQYAARLLEAFGSPEGVYHADQGAYEALDLPPKVKAALQDKSLREADQVLDHCQRLGIRVVTIQDAGYPQRLREIDTPPAVLYVKGTLPDLDQEAAVAIVGARKASPYGIAAARKLGHDLARQGAVVVSGSAWGIDQAALQGAIQAGGRVVSVLGNGIDVIYPQGAQSLYEDVAKAGAVLSEYPPGTEPRGAHFPVRNRLIAGLSLGVVVAEGTETSGSLITARWALEQGRDVFAVPGSIDSALSRGPNGLIRRGEAMLIQDAWDILEEYQFLYPAKLQPRNPLPQQAEAARLAPEPVKEETVPKGAVQNANRVPEKPPEADILVVDLRQEPEAFTDDEAAILRTLQVRGALTPDDLTEATGIPARRILSALTLLQIRRLVGEETGKRFTTKVLLKE